MSNTCTACIESAKMTVRENFEDEGVSADSATIEREARELVALGETGCTAHGF